jgi:isochorismate hydrolase
LENFLQLVRSEVMQELKTKERNNLICNGIKKKTNCGKN